MDFCHYALPSISPAYSGQLLDLQLCGIRKKHAVILREQKWLIWWFGWPKLETKMKSTLLPGPILTQHRVCSRAKHTPLPHGLAALRFFSTMLTLCWRWLGFATSSSCMSPSLASTCWRRAFERNLSGTSLRLVSPAFRLTKTQSCSSCFGSASFGPASYVSPVSVA